MDAQVKFAPAFATLFVTLQPGDSIVAESDAMASMSPHLEIHTHFNGGFLNAILRKVFGGETLFINEFVCPVGGPPAELVLTQPTPGDVTRIDLKGNTLCLQPGAFLACGRGVTMTLGWAGFTSWINGEGLFRLQVSGQGPVWIGGYGGVIKRPVDGSYVIDSGHLLAYEPTVSLNFRLPGGIFSSFFGGEGFVTEMRGQGEVYMQSRSIDGLASWTNSHFPY